MNHDAIVRVATANDGMSRVEALHASFIDGLGERGVPQRFKNSLTVKDGIISTVAWGHTFAAIPRVVRSGESEYAVEYTFEHKAGDTVTPIWRFYLTNGGLLTSSLDDQASRLGDYNSPHVAEVLLTPLNLAILDSQLFAPALPISG